MRVAYVAGWPQGPSSGPFKKIAAQTAAWMAQGIDVGIFVLTTAEHRESWKTVAGVRLVIARTSGPRLAIQKEELLRAALKWSPDVIYHRWSLTYPGLILAERRVPVVLEINTDDVAEYDLMSPWKSRLNRLTRGVVLKRAAGLVFVTEELSKFRVFERYHRPSAVVANGISLADVAGQPAPSHARPRLLLIGQPNSPWHGVDKLMWLAERRPDWDFDIVGPSCEEIPQRMPNVTVHGLLHAHDYQAVIANADIGVGTLALHRKGLNEASTLKVREYLASGLPVVLGYADTDFPDGAACVLQLPNSEDNVRRGVARIDEFVGRWKGRRVARSDIAHLDYAEKERRRIEFLRSLVVHRGTTENQT